MFTQKPETQTDEYELKTVDDDTQHVCSEQTLEEENQLLEEHKDFLQTVKVEVESPISNVIFDPSIRSVKAKPEEIEAITKGEILPNASPAIVVDKDAEQKILDEIIQKDRIERLKQHISDRRSELAEARNTFYEKYVKSKHEKLISYAIVDDKDKIIMKMKNLDGVQIYQNFTLVLVDHKDKILVKFNSPSDLLTVRNALNYMTAEPETPTNKDIQEWATRCTPKK